MDVVRTNFNFESYGFRFVNSFGFPVAVSFRLPNGNAVNLGDIFYGLCGGMCFSVLDHFYANKPVPLVDDVKKISYTNLIYLWNRQLDSLRLKNLVKVFDWMLRDDMDICLRMARYEIPKLRRRLDKGDPVVLALINVRGLGNPTLNHQVLATGYDYDETSKRMSIYLYDPNYPYRPGQTGYERSLCLDLTRPGQGLNLSMPGGAPPRGFFVIEYQRKAPPSRW